MAAQRGSREGGREVCYATAVSVTATSSHHRRFGQRSACMDGQQRGRRNGDLFYLLSQCFLSRVGMETGWSWKWPFYCGHCKSRLPSLHWANFNDGGGGGRGGVESAELLPAPVRVHLSTILATFCPPTRRKARLFPPSSTDRPPTGPPSDSPFFI